MRPAFDCAIWPRHPSDRMNFTHLFAFYQVARAGSVSAGADRLCVSQPAVTREIQTLEDRLRLKLFDRGPRGVVLTEAGTALFRHAEQIFLLADVAESEMKELAGLSAGHLKIGASATLGVYFLPDIIASFQTKHPQVEIDLVVSNTQQVEDGLRDQQFSLGFVEGPFRRDTLEARLIGADEIAAVAAAGHPQVGSALSPHSLANRAVILREPGSGTRAMIELAFAEMGLTIEPMMSLSNTEAIKRMLMAQSYIAFLSMLSVKAELQRGELALIEVRELRAERLLHMVWLKGRSLSPIAQAFFKRVFSEETPKIAAA
jgi:DNA-binding transcriptional LysR family regulator